MVSVKLKLKKFSLKKLEKLTLLQHIRFRRSRFIIFQLHSLYLQNLKQFVHGRLWNFESFRPICDFLHGYVRRTSQLRAARQKFLEWLQFDVYQLRNLLDLFLLSRNRDWQ